jgi:hypothetical protein
VFQTFQDEDVLKKNHVQCTQSWWGKRNQTDFVLFQNEVVGSKKSFDVFCGKAVGRVLCLFEWKDDEKLGVTKRHSLAFIDILLPMKLTIGQKSASGNDQAFLKHHGMFLLQRPSNGIGQQVVDISCFRRAAHVIPTDIWENQYWFNNYIDLETYNDVYDMKAWC